MFQTGCKVYNVLDHQKPAMAERCKHVFPHWWVVERVIEAEYMKQACTEARIKANYQKYGPRPWG